MKETPLNMTWHHTPSTDFREGDIIYYPKCGVGKVLALETMTVEDVPYTFLVIELPKERALLRVPLEKAEENYLSRLGDIANRKSATEIMKVLSGPPKSGRGMWQRRKLNLEGRITSPNLLELAAAARDLNRSTELSVSERWLKIDARDRLCDILSMAWGCSKEAAKERIEKKLKEAERHPLFD